LLRASPPSSRGRRHSAANETSGIKPVVDRSFPLEELADAFRYLNAGRHFGKVCIDV